MADHPGRRRDFEPRNRTNSDRCIRTDTDRRRRTDTTDRRSRPSSHHSRPNSEHDEPTYRPKIKTKRRSYPPSQSHNQHTSSKAYNHGDNSYGMNSDTYLVHNQLDGNISDHNGSSKNNHYQRNNSRGGNGNFKTPSWPVRETITGWYSICVPNIENCDEVLNKIKIHISPLLFYPYNKKYSNNKLNFLVDDYDVAIALQNTSRKLIQRDERKLFINVFSYLPKRVLISYTPVSREVREKMLEAMVTRYNHTTKSLDLSKFYACTLFTDNELFVPLNRPAVLLAALNMAAQQTRYELYCLSLANNHIYLSEGIVWIRRLFPELKVLDLAGNKFSDLKELTYLSGYSIEELNLSKNPLCDAMDNEYYRRTVQKLFPMLSKLDNLDLPYLYKPVIGSKFKMPVNLGNSYPIQQDGGNVEQPNPVMTLVELFLKHYYERYDNNVTRKTVLNAYHEHATFSLSSSLLATHYMGSLAEYIPESRNLLEHDLDKNINHLVHRGKANVINILEKLPKTKHDFGSFIIDVPIANSEIIQVVVNGVFAEEFNENSNLQVFRSFCRTFSLVPSVNGWIISTDMMFVTLVSFELMIESSKRFYVLMKPSVEDHELNKNSLNMSMLTNNTMPDILSLKMSEPTVHESLSSAQQLCPLSPPRDQWQTSPFQTSVVQNIESTYQQQNHHVAPISVFPNSQQSNASFPVPKTVSIKSKFPTISTSAKRQSTKMHLNSANSPNDNTSNKLLMIKRFSDETGMNEEWSKKCLVENNWDYATAALCFSKLKSNIPPVAYIR